MLKAYKFRMYPNKEQEVLLSKTFGCVRFVYNQMLSDRKKSYEEYKKSDDEFKKMKYPTPAQYKKEFEWLKEVDSLALANAQMNLTKAYSNFFRDKSVGFPKFKSRKKQKDTYTTNNQSHGGKWSDIRIADGKIKLPKFKTMIKIKQHRHFEGIIKSATVSKTKTGKYFVSLLVEQEDCVKLENTGNEIGLDLGVKYFAIDTNGEFHHNPKFYRKYHKQLIKEQRKLSRKQLQAKKSGKKLVDCSNYQKNRKRVAKIHEKITNSRKDFLHKLSTELIRNNDVIVMEDLKVANMIKFGNLSKDIADVSWSEFRRMIEYKSEWYGRKVQFVDPKYTSQTCSECGYRHKENRKTQSEFECLECGHKENADINAAKNILKRKTVGTTD